MNTDGRVQSNMGVAVGDVQNQGRMGMIITTFFDDFFPLLPPGPHRILR